ncbi:MAG: hypothetical protein D6753_14950 [Planctomycetota bacterium]|nr:MAG: hypothetical protein D6753_14950 [Planctomycetota bacterium]
MKVTGFTIVRNAVRYDYPVVESIRSALPLVDEMLVAVGNSCDGTRDLVAGIDDPKLRIIDTVWDDTLRKGGTILAQQTNLAMDACQGDWLLYLQADEVLHEQDTERIRRAMQRNLQRRWVEGLTFRYHHFRADYWIRDPLPYRRQVRIVRGGIGVRSHGDACGFRIHGRRLRTAPTGAWVYHYGYVKPPQQMSAKMDYFLSLYDGRQVAPGSESAAAQYAWDLATCEAYRGSHPQVMAQRIASKDWQTPQVELLPRWRNSRFWKGMYMKNTRALRRWARVAGLLGAMLCAVLCALVAKPARAASPPNILLIAIDDLNDWVGCLGGHPQSSTPHIDALASRSVLFTNAHCQAPVCNPSRTSFLTGMRPSTTGVYLNNVWFRSTPLNRKRVTLPQYFRQHGYATLTAGKIFHGSRVDDPSFEVVGPRPGQRLPIDEQVIEDVPTKSKLWDFGPQRYAEDKFPDAVVASWAVEQLQQSFDRPFLMAVGFYRPHVPLYAPQRLFDALPVDTVQLPPVLENDRADLPEAALQLTANPTPPPHQWFVETGRWAAAVQAYHAAVRFTDEQVGRVLAALQSSPYADNTIVVLLSDQGFHLGEKQRWAKQSLWERSTRVPFIVHVPENGAQGQRCDAPVELLSVFPTLVELAELPPLDALEGVSLQPLLADPDTTWERPAITTYQPNNHAVRSRHFRYIRYADGAEELYDHRNDPHEWYNLANLAEYDHVKAEHARWLPQRNAPDLGAK